MTDDGTSVLVGGNLAIGIGDNDNLFHIEATDNTYDVSRAIEIDYTKSHSTTGWGASAFGVRTNVYADGTGQNADIQGGSFTATHNGSGISYYLLGTQSNAKHQGSGNTGAIWGAFNQAKISGSGTGTHPFLIGTNQKAELANANASVGSMSGILSVVKTSAGDITGRMDAAWLQIDGNQGATTVVDANVLYLQADTGSITASGTMRTIHSISTLPSLFAGSIESPKFFIGTSEANYLEEDGNGVTRLYGDAGISIDTSDGVVIDISDVVVVNSEVEATSIKRTGGTSSQFLKADGTVDSSTYSTTDTQLTTEEVQDIVGAMVSSNTEQSISVTYTDGDGKLNFDAGAATYTHPGETAFTAAVDTGALTGAVVVSDIDMNITTNAFGHVTDAAMAVATRTLTLANLGFTGDVDATNDQTLNEVISSGNTYTNGTSVWTFDSGQISNLDSGEGWGVILSPEEGLLFTNGSGNTSGKSYVQGNSLAIGNGSHVGKIFSANLTAERDFELPNAAGTLALTSQLPTDFVSAASGGSFGGGIVADSFTITGLSSGTSFLKANGSLDGTLYNSGGGTSGGIAIYDGTNTTTDDANLQFNFLEGKLSTRNLTVANDVGIGNDLDVTGNIECSVIQADSWTYVPQIMQSNFSHTSGNGYMNMPFGNLGDNSNAGEQSFVLATFGGYVESFAMKNTATSTAMTGTNLAFRIRINGTTVYTSSTQTFTAAARTYKGWALTSTDAVFNAGDDINFQFICTSGLWRDCTATIVTRCII